MKGAGMMNGKHRYRHAKRRRSFQKQGDAPKEGIEKDLSPSSPSPNPKRRKKCLDAPGTRRSSFLEKLRLRLSGGHFRMLNEKMYTCSGNEAFHFFKKEPKLFDLYHAGYQEQMSRWPEQPVNIIIKWLKSHSSSLVVADFGCGNASLARTVNNKVFSIDLVSTDPSVIACDMSNTPLESKSVDVAVFCLSLMGINYHSYLKEANRVLKPCGWLLIAEVRSRFDPSNGGADPDKFSEAVKQLGFSLSSKDFTNKMFVLFYFKKKEGCASNQKAIDWPELKPCLYKRR
ncbi:ribosomal RNA-processing protein 8 [Phalaenopsis equestris]|uniref:ribosomal RNA-processing protein 8 n=1 Tax=Phalaenopsis equestris TaxID=78828 RepID=UPI0009E32BE3|nr:ribosomal RNA-processing protein 8 [Phalaenopsis equestris]